MQLVDVPRTPSLSDLWPGRMRFIRRQRQIRHGVRALLPSHDPDGRMARLLSGVRSKADERRTRFPIHVSLLMFFQIRWVTHRFGGRLWWICPRPHPSLFDLEDWFGSKIQMTCARCLRPERFEWILDRHSEICAAPYDRHVRPRRTLLYCLRCNRVHSPQELTNSPCRRHVIRKSHFVVM